MFEWILKHQMDIMLALCAVCAMMAVMLVLTRFLPKRRKQILLLMELVAMFLLAFDRASYVYRGDVSRLGYVMVRLSNFMVFFLTPAVVMGFNLYLTDLILEDGKTEKVPKRLVVSQIAAMLGMVLAVIAHFSGLYYYFDEQNCYHRGPGFLISYIIPVLVPLIQFTVIQDYRQRFSRLIYISLVLYVFVPITAGIIQIFAYGISIVNMAMVLVSISLFIFAYLDINNEVLRAHELEVTNLENEQRSMRRLFDQTATAFVTAVEKRDRYSQGHSARAADYARRIAAAAGKSEEECDKIYYATLLHDVGMIGIPDSVLEKAGDLNAEEYECVKQKPVLSAEILSSITEYPYLRRGVQYACEKYDGSGYPDGLKGEEIPEVSRIIAVADAYDTMTSKKRFRDPLSYQVVREEFVKQSGIQFDPEFSEIIVKIMDEEFEKEAAGTDIQTETELICKKYRETVSRGIEIGREVVRIRFDCEDIRTRDGDFSAPSLILFDSYDRAVHSDAKTIKAYQYLEYGEIWFSGHYVSTAARNIAARREEAGAEAGTGRYEIRAGRFEDHLSIRMLSPSETADIVVALPDNTKAAYIGLTGENCHIRNIEVTKTEKELASGDIEKIADAVSYINRLESDIPNVQIDYPRAAHTEGIEIGDRRRIDFHTMSLPTANLVWHCPYIVLFCSEDRRVGGEGYREYALIQINGEATGDNDYAENRFFMKKKDAFPGWEEWKRINREGMECSVTITRRDNKILLRTENLGIAIENTCVIHDGGAVYAALTGDQVALTDIRVR